MAVLLLLSRLVQIGVKMIEATAAEMTATAVVSDKIRP